MKSWWANPNLTLALTSSISLALHQSLRQCAQHRQLDLTDAFEEYSGTLQEKNTGIMTKNRFRSTMGTLFRGNLKKWVLDALCAQYGTGDPDPREPGTFRFVRWKQFAIDFDNVAPLPPPPLPDPTPEIVEAMRGMNAYCNLNGIDLAWDFEEHFGGKNACSSDICTRQKFVGALGVLLGRATSLYQLDGQLLDDICIAYAAGNVEGRTQPGYGGGKPQYTHVQWKEFALDVNRIQSQPFLERLAGGRPGGGGDWSTGVVVYPQLGQVGEAYPELDEAGASPIRPVYGTAPTACTAPTRTGQRRGPQCAESAPPARRGRRHAGRVARPCRAAPTRPMRGASCRPAPRCPWDHLPPTRAAEAPRGRGACCRQG